ncbi:GSCOCG00007282001-RA-CDS [Cotesia congregata]|nr:GSCOCG00007282001-RA-CDS [Cotesia congregata]
MLVHYLKKNIRKLLMFRLFFFFNYKLIYIYIYIYIYIFFLKRYQKFYFCDGGVEENPPLPSTSGGKPAPLPVSRSVVPPNNPQPGRNVVPVQKTYPNLQDRPKIVPMPPPQDIVKLHSIRTIAAQMTKFLYGTLKFYPDSIKSNDALYMVISDGNRSMVCWVYGWIKNLFKKKIKDGLKIRVKNFTVRAVTIRLNRFPQYNLEMVLNSTTDFHVYDDDKPVIVHLFNESVPFKLDPNVKVITHRYRTLMDILNSHTNKSINFIGVIVDQTSVIQTTSVTVRRITVQDESGTVEVALWRRDGENFSIPTGQIIIGHNFYVDRKFRVNFTPCSNGHTLTVAPKSPDESRLREWMTSLYSNTKRPIYFGQQEDSDEEKSEKKPVQPIKRVQPIKPVQPIKSKKQKRKLEKEKKRQLKIERRRIIKETEEESFREIEMQEMKDRIAVGEELEYLQEIKKKMERMANHYIQTDGLFDLGARKDFKTWALPPEVIPAEELPRIVEKNKIKKI